MDSGQVAIACKIQQHVHNQNGDIHLQFEIIMPGSCEDLADKLRSAFNRMMERLANGAPLHKESYEGSDISMYNTSIEDYYAQAILDPKDSN